MCVCVIKCVGVKLSRQHTPCLPRHRFKLSWKCRNLLLIIIFFPPCSSSVKHGRQNPPDSLPFFPAFPSNLFHVVSLCSLVRLERSDSAEHFQNALFLLFFFPFFREPGITESCHLLRARSKYGTVPPRGEKHINLDFDLHLFWCRY